MTKVEKEMKMRNLDKILSFVNVEALKTSSGMKRENIYKKDIFADCITDTDKKTTRRKLRNVLDNFVKTILTCTDKMKLKKYCIEFDKYYKAVYNLNDYSLQSICSNNTDEIKKANLQKFLQIVSSNVSEKKTTKKNTTKTITETKIENNEEAK